MEKFEDLVKQDTPRLVVMFKLENGAEMFGWGMVGEIPRLTTIGAIVRVQSELYFKAGKYCPGPALVIAYNPIAKSINWFINPDIPIDPLAGMLETIKHAILSAGGPKLPTATPILGPDGVPIRNEGVR